MKRLMMYLLLSLAFVCGAAQGAEGSEKQTVQGKIDSTDFANQALVIDGVRYEIDFEALVVTVRGNQAFLGQFQAGDRVTIDYEVRTGPVRKIVIAIRK